MTKRESDQDTPIQYENCSKKPKHSTSDCPLNFERISRDELSQVMNFLINSDLISFAITSRGNYRFVREYIEQNYPLAVEHSVVGEKNTSWTLSRVLRIHDKIVIGLAEPFMSLFTKIANQYGGNLDVLTRKLDFEYISSTIVFENLFDIPVEGVKFQNMTIPHVFLEPNSGNTYSSEGERTDSETRIVHQKTISQIPLGYMLKRVALNIENDVKDVFTILKYCQSLEKLKVSIGDSVSDAKEFEDGIYCPLLSSLKSLKIETHIHIDEVPSQKHVVDLLKLTPNLEKLDIFFHHYCDVNIYQHIARMCPKIKRITVDLDQGYGSLETTINDDELYNFMKALPNLEHISISKSSEISGEIFSKIGEFTKLRHFQVIRGFYDIGIRHLVPQASDIRFGGGILPNLTYLDYGHNFSFSEEEKASLLESIQKMAPNLKFLNEYGL